MSVASVLGWVNLTPIVPVPPETQEALFRSVFVTLRNPLTRPPFFLGLELAMYVCAVLTFMRALQAHRKGDTWPMFLWATTFAYGLLIEVVSYNFVDNFTHGPFTVMFYRDKLPLYVSVLYPVFITTAATTVRKLGLGKAAEPLAIGLMIVAIDFPFDICGPIAHWWAWSSSDPNIAYRWYGVPVTSYYWHLAFGGILCWLVRAFSGRVSRSKRPLTMALALAFPIGLATMVLGFLAFLPFHGLKAAHVSDGVIVAALFGVAAFVTFFTKKTPAPEAAMGLSPVLILWFGWHVVVAGMLAAQGRLSLGPIATIAGAMAVGGAFHFAGRRHAPAEVASSAA